MLGMFVHLNHMENSKNGVHEQENIFERSDFLEGTF